MRRAFVDVNEQNLVRALTGSQLGDACHGHAYDILPLNHVDCAKYLVDLRRQLAHNKFRIACGTLERLVQALNSRGVYNSDGERINHVTAIHDFVRLGGVDLILHVLSLTDEDIRRPYSKSSDSSRSSDSRREESFLVFIGQVLGIGLDIVHEHERERQRRAREEESDDDDDDDEYNEDESDEDASDDNSSFRLRQTSSAASNSNQFQEQEGDPPLERFSREVEMEDSNSHSEDEIVDTEEDVYRSVTEEENIQLQLTPVSRILERLVNHPHLTPYLCNMLRRHSLVLLREAVFLVSSFSNTVANSNSILTTIFGHLCNQSLFFTVVPLLEELTAFHLSDCCISSVGLFLFHCSIMPFLFHILGCGLCYVLFYFIFSQNR